MSRAGRSAPAGAHGAPAENPLGELQLGTSLNAMRYWPEGTFASDTSTLTPSLRSMTRTLPVTAEPSERNRASRPAGGRGVTSTYGDVAGADPPVEHPASATQATATRRTQCPCIVTRAQ